MLVLLAEKVPHLICNFHKAETTYVNELRKKNMIPKYSRIAKYWNKNILTYY